MIPARRPWTSAQPISARATVVRVACEERGGQPLGPSASRRRSWARGGRAGAPAVLWTSDQPHGVGVGVGVGVGGRADQVRAIDPVEHPVTLPSAASASSSSPAASWYWSGGQHALQQAEPQEQQRGLRDVRRGSSAGSPSSWPALVQPLDLRAVDADLAGQADQAGERVEAARPGRAVIGEPVAQVEVALLAVAVAHVALPVVPAQRHAVAQRRAARSPAGRSCGRCTSRAPAARARRTARILEQRALAAIGLATHRAGLARLREPRLAGGSPITPSRLTR